MVLDRKNSSEMKSADNKRAFVKKRSKVTASEVRKHVISGLLPINRLADGENGFDLDISMMGKVVFTEPVPPIDVETSLEQRKTCLLYSISSPKSSKPIFEYVSDDVEVKIIRQDGLSDHNYTTYPNIENIIRDLCGFYCDDFSLVHRKHVHLSTEDIKDRWNLEKLTALRVLRPQIFHSGLRVMDREPSTISLEGPGLHYDLTDPSKFASEQFYVSMLKKSAIDKNTLLYSMLSKNRVKHFMNCINTEEKEWRWEKRGIPRLPEQEETPKLFVKVEKASVDPFFEPLFLSMAIYDIRNKQKVTESVYFNIADDDKLDMLGKYQPNFINSNLQSLFNITGVLSDMFLVIKIEKVLQQTDVFDGSEPYTGTKEEKNVEKLKASAEEYCQRLGAYRTPLGVQIIDIQRIFNANVSASMCGTDRRTDPMVTSSCTMTSGVVITTAGHAHEDRCSITSADRTSITSMGSTLRRFGSGTSAATVFSRVRTPLTKRKFATTSSMSVSKDIPDCLDNMPPSNLKLSTFFRLEGDKTSEEDIYRICNEARKNHGKINKKTFNFELELTVAGSNKSKECQSHGSNLTLNSANLIHEAMEIPMYKSFLNKSYKNLLFVYPKHINLSNRTGNARNIMLKIELMDASETPQEVVFENGSSKSRLLKCAKTTVIYHNRTPHFTDEIKIALPCDLNDGYHLLFTVYHISCKDGDSESAENAIGYTWLPLYCNGKLRSNDFQLPVCGEKPPASYGYLDSRNALPNLKWIDNHKPIFACSIKVISSVHAQDDYLEKFMTGVASLSSNNPKKPPVAESALIFAIDNLLKARPDKLVAFIHFILSRLLFLIANPPYSDELTVKVFECLGNLVKLFSRMLDSDIDAHNRSMLLASFVKYRKQATQESKSHSNIRPVEFKASPTENTLLASMIEHVERSQSSTNVGATNVRLHENLLEVWLRARSTARENSIVHCWFLLEVILKSCTEYLTMTGRMFSSRKIRFGDQFLKNVETLVEIIAQEVINRHANDFDEARVISTSLGYFLRDCFSIMDRTFVMKLIHKYLTAFSESMKKLSHCNELLSIKIDFIRVVCSYEHYLIVNILNDIEQPTEEGAAPPPMSSLTGRKYKR
uniref:C2 DOCK-type domain-containing protein n=1 Tax=Caenorhabditis japonica TaxID=281687 RepID=A0A8R1I0C6_CAEJA